MIEDIGDIGDLFKAFRDHLNLTQDNLAERAGTNRSVVAHLEQGRRVPDAASLARIAEVLGVPEAVWKALAASEIRLRLDFEEQLAELVGHQVSAPSHQLTRKKLETQIEQLLTQNSTPTGTLDRLNSIMVFYGVAPMSWEFFKRYMGVEAFTTVASFAGAVEAYQIDAIRLFSTFAEAYATLNRSGDTFDRKLSALNKRDLQGFHERAEWALVEMLSEARLPDLGYISAARVKQEEKERQAVKSFLEDLAGQIEAEGNHVIQNIPEKTRRKFDTLLRKFDTRFENGLFSTLFKPDADDVRREAERLAPKTDDELARMEETQSIAFANLSAYLAADHMDVYVATSMRSDADFVSVNQFVSQLFVHQAIRQLKLRYFNPTQSWLDDRIGKGLVEALMLRRSAMTVYMAQKSDSFGKDSEASVALGQGKPVIVYVPKLHFKAIDSEELFALDRKALLDRIEDDEDVDDTVDDTALVGRVLKQLLERLLDDELCDVARAHYADFDLLGESLRIEDEDLRARFRTWIEQVIAGKHEPLEELRAHVISILISVTLGFEKRATVFKEVHPLALQVILSTGVLNGILVVRSVDRCATVMKALLENDLTLRLETDEQNYRLIETTTGSTIRVISRNDLLQRAFETFYRINDQE